MTLQEAIEVLIEYKDGNKEFGCGDFMHGAALDVDLAEAVATILNAVVKGELK